MPLLHIPYVALGRAGEAVKAWCARADAARVEPEDVERVPDDRGDVLPPSRDEVCARPPWPARVDEDCAAVVGAVPRGDHAQRDRGFRSGRIGGEVVKGEEEACALLAVVAGCPVDLRGGLELDRKGNVHVDTVRGNACESY